MEHGENLLKESTPKNRLKVFFLVLIMVSLSATVTIAIILFCIIFFSYEGFEGLKILLTGRVW